MKYYFLAYFFFLDFASLVNPEGEVNPKISFLLSFLLG